MKIRQLLPALTFAVSLSVANGATLEEEFRSPPDSARPGVYWYFMDGNSSRQGMTADLESMKEVGLGNLVFLEVNVGVPRGPVDFMSEQWQALFAHAVHEAERLGIDITLGVGPGWTGSGGPWVKAAQSMQHLVFSVVETKGPEEFDAVLPLPGQRSTRWHKMRSPFYEDVVVYAFPRRKPIIRDVNEKALYERDPYTSMPGVKPWLPAPAQYREPGSAAVISLKDMVDLTGKLDSDGRLRWDVPAGEWNIVRMGRRSTGAATRPAPEPGVGLECDKFDTAAFDDHFANFVGKLLKKVGPRKDHGWTTLHMDSWEMGSQNWTRNFREEFTKRRGYDPMPYLPTYTGRAVESLALTERFLWDVRMTCQELVLENHVEHLKKMGRKHGFDLSIEPYDMNPTADLDLGAVADVPMCEFWSAGYGFDSSFTCIEASSIAHTMGRPIVSSEAFTADSREGWRQYPWSMKNQGDWAFCMGINRFVYHTFAHKPLGDEYRPGMTMGPYGVHWDRGQTWWPMVKDYHRYVTRCSHLLRQGVTVSDILYLTPEGAPHVFRAPASALQGHGPLADKKGYGFDGCSPNILMDRASVKDGHIVFPGGTVYRLLVLPQSETMTPRLLTKVIELVEAGAVVLGTPPVASPSLSGYPQCDTAVQRLANRLWGDSLAPVKRVGKGRIMLDSVVQPEHKPKRKPLLPNTGSWIWFDEGDPASDATAGDVHFNYTWNMSDMSSLQLAEIEATADNSFMLKVNGKEILKGSNWNEIQSADITSALRPGKNTIAAVANNSASTTRNPAGFMAAMRLSYSDGSKKVIATNQKWLASRNGTNWSAGKKLGPGNMAPWSLSGAPAATRAKGLYPDYATTAEVLEKMGVPEDFTSDGPVRYTHRQTDDADIYFIANTSASKVKTTCTFRVIQGAPELWDPVTGEIRSLPEFTRLEQTTSFPITLEPHQSFFVIFSGKGEPKRLEEAEGVNSPAITAVATLEGAWEVCFDPKWGGPEKVTFPNLQDWTHHAERGIKYYSGIATYRKSFELLQESGERIYLDLGTVQDIARVRLNGKDLGVVWCAPWRVDITDAVKTKGNALELEVANRWPNRLFGDQQAPDKGVRTVKWDSGFLGGREYKTGRYTFATTGGHNRLLPSGLLGPVRILVNQK